MNPAGAEWCGMCHRRFPPAEMSVEEIDSPAEVLFGGELQEDEEVQATNGSTATPVATAAGETMEQLRPQARGAFTVTDAGIVWTCSNCETKNPLEAQFCSVCGTTFAQVVQPKVERPKRDPNTAALLSLLFPGAGHVYIGLVGQAIARAVLSLWVTSVIVLSLLSGDKSNSQLVVIVFGLVATALWMITAHDAYREAKDESASVILKGKMFLYLTLGLLMLLFVLLVGASFQASG